MLLKLELHLLLLELLLLELVEQLLRDDLLLKGEVLDSGHLVGLVLLHLRHLHTSNGEEWEWG